VRNYCTWCGIELTDNNTKTVAGKQLCDNCTGKPLNNETYASVREFIDNLDQPVIIIENDTEITMVNKAAENVFLNNSAILEKSRAGDALQCTCAKLPGGCGKTIHCKACAIRQAVENTRKTGKGYNNIKAFQYVNTPNGKELRTVVISTEKAWNTVLVQVHELNQSQCDNAPEQHEIHWQEE
jgi:nitrogen-specific signal transduction histidine kinase